MFNLTLLGWWKNLMLVQFILEKIIFKGSLSEIFINEKITEGLIWKIIKAKISPIFQKGKVHYFKRRNPEDSEIFKDDSVRLIFNKIRCVDALDYPRAFLSFGNKKELNLQKQILIIIKLKQAL